MSAIARRPSSKARSFRPRAASIKPEDAERRAVVRLRLHDLLLLGASRFKRSARSCLIFGHARQQTFTKAAAQNNRVFGPAWIVAQRDECSFGRSRIAFGQSAKEPGVRGAGDGARSLREDCINRLVERPGVRFPAEIILVHEWPAFRRCRARSLTRDPAQRSPRHSAPGIGN